MRLDFISFLIGFVVAAAVAAILYRFRAQLARVRSSAEGQAGSTRRFITSTSETRYYNDLVKAMNARHIAGDVVKLTDIYVEPRFIRGIEPVDPSDERPRSVFHVVPLIHDMPACYASYNIETLSINDLQSSDPHLALLGMPGSGKSTALAIMALVAAEEIELETIDVMSDEVFEDETKDLPPADKEKLLQQRQDLQQRAIDQLKLAQERDKEQGKVTREAIDFHRLLPIVVHLRDIDLRPEAYGVQPGAAANGKSSGKQAVKPLKTLDPAEPIVKALQHRASTVTASALPRMVYNRLTAGTCFVMIDGYEDLPFDECPEKLLWLKQFMDIYGANFIIVTGPATGYDPLVNLGLTPIFLRPWGDAEFERLIGRWAMAWPTIAGTARRPAPIPEERIVRRVATNNRGRLPLDVTLKTWAAFSGDEQEVGRIGWYDFYVRHHYNSKEARPAMERVAATMLDLGGKPLTRDRMKELITAAVTGPDGKTVANPDDVLGKLTGNSSLMIEWPGGAYGFVHPLLTGFLAGSWMIYADNEMLNAMLANPAWEIAFPFGAARTEVDSAVTQRLSEMPDLLYSNLFSIVSWLPDSPPNAAWRAEIFKRLTAALLSPSQYPAIRERAMAALVASRDKNVGFILRQALRSPDPNVRRLGCVGLGALGEGEAIKDLGPMLTDSDPDVTLAAGLALGAIGTEAALETMLAGFVDGEASLRQAVAEALAAIPGEGYAVLRDAMNSKDMMVRRAAVYGLSRVRAAWALALLYRALLEDEQWYVRNAAEQAFLSAERPDESGVTRHPEADALPWLVSWAAQRGEGVPAGQSARQILIRVLQEGDPVARAAAARTLANLGHVPALKPLYGALRDRDEKVRAAVYEALGNLQNRLGEEFPAVV
jgi:HEAT repeat protein/energy-coupling factor transporter ATP-binding protein EcfA2